MHKRVRILVRCWLLYSACGAALSLAFLCQSQGAPVFSVQPSGNAGFDIMADGKLVALIRLAAADAIQAGNVVTNTTGISLSALHTKDPLAATFAPDDFVSITLPAADPSTPPTVWEPVVKFKLTVRSFNTNRWLA